MTEILKIISPVDVKNKIQSTPKTHPDAIFDLSEPDGLSKDGEKIVKNEEESSRQELLRHLNKEIYLPLLNQTKIQADSLRKLVLYARLFQVSSDVITEEFFNEFFFLPKELLGELLNREEAATLYKGDFFDALRSLAKMENQPRLLDSIATLLKHFDCYVNQKQSLQSIIAGGHHLKDMVIKRDSAIIGEQIEMLESLLESGRGDYKEVSNFLKKSFIPVLRNIATGYAPADKVNDAILSVIHHIVRYDKANFEMLQEAFADFAEELRPLLDHITSGDIDYLRDALSKDAKIAKEDAEGKISIQAEDEKDMAALLSKALDKSSPAKISSAAQNMLLHMIQSESPMQPLLHFMIPLRFRHEDTYGEFFIDKECKEKKGEAKQATNIFFTIQSDLYGTFEVDLLAKDQYIELDIKCPGELIGAVEDVKSQFRDSIEEAGYRLSGYSVEEYKESRTILKRFPELKNRRAGIDIRI